MPKMKIWAALDSFFFAGAAFWFSFVGKLAFPWFSFVFSLVSLISLDFGQNVQDKGPGREQTNRYA